MLTKAKPKPERLSMGKTELIIIGAGGLGRELAAMVRGSDLSKIWQVLGFVDDGIFEGNRIDGLPLLGNLQWLENQEDGISVALGIGAPIVKTKVIEKLNSKKFVFPNLVHPTAQMIDRERVEVGFGNIICANAILTTSISIGNFNVINLSCTIGHDVKMGNFCSLMPSVNVSGNVILEDEVLIGTGAQIIKKAKLGKGCRVGAGGVVNKNVAAGQTVTGVPAKAISR